MVRRHRARKLRLIFGMVFCVLVFLPAAAKGEDEESLLENRIFRHAQIPEMEPIETYGAFFGLKITLKIEGGWNAFPGGDIERGITGMYKNAVDAVAATSFPVLEDVRGSAHGGIEVGGDLIYCLTPLFGIGVGAARMGAGKESHLLYRRAGADFGSMQIWPRIRVSAFRAGLFYSLPFAGRLAVSFRGGPALFLARYDCALSSSLGFLRDGLIHTYYSQNAKASQPGFDGGIGLEFNPNPFVAIFIEAQGRYARIRGFEGDEEATFLQSAQVQRTSQTGPVYFVETVTRPQLDILPPGEAGSARKATLDFSGASILVGLKFRL